jgi:hypothetical protein
MMDSCHSFARAARKALILSTAQDVHRSRLSREHCVNEGV